MFDWKNLTDIPNLQSRSISMENPRGEKGAGGSAASPLGAGRKGAPCLFDLPPGSKHTLADITGPGCIHHIWITTDIKPHVLRSLILRFYWDDLDYPSIECPLGEFFGTAHGRTIHYVSALTAQQQGQGLNNYMPMPFHKRGLIELEVDTVPPLNFFFYQIDYTLGDEVKADDSRLCCMFRRQNPTREKEDFVILPQIEGEGRFLGTVCGVRPLQAEWWGEGEIKIYLDGEDKLPTICGTGTEDYVGTAWGLGEHYAFYQGCPYYKDNLVSFYRWHVPDPVYFHESIKVTIQQIGHKMDSGYFERVDDWSAAAFWYQKHPLPLPEILPARDKRLEKIIEDADKKK